MRSRSSFALGALAGSSTGYGGVTICDPKDDSFYCKLHRLANEIHMLLFLIMIILVPLYFIGKKTGLFNKFIKS